MTVRLTRRLLETTRGCALRLWRDVHQPAPRGPRGPALGYLHEVRAAYSDHVPEHTVRFDPVGDDDATAAATALALASPDVPGVLAGVLDTPRQRVRLHAVWRHEEGFELVALRAAKKVKPADLRRLALQWLAMDAAGHKVFKATVVHLARDATFDTGEPAPRTPAQRRPFLRHADVTANVRKRLKALREELDLAAQVVAEPEAPAVERGPHCYHAGGCPFLPDCGEPAAVAEIAKLPRIDRQHAASLVAKGATGLQDVFNAHRRPSRLQRRVQAALLQGERYTGPELKPSLEGLRYPLHFIDFELYAPAFPRFAHTTPFQQVPMQWSAHTLHADGRTQHHAFVHTDARDPHEAFAASLLAALHTEGSVLTWSPSEDRLIGALAKRLPDHRAGLRALRRRLVDLQAIVRTSVYEPGFEGSFSLKRVLPALVPGAGWNDLNIANGHAAQQAWDTFVDASPDTRDRLAHDLAVYCERDTDAMLQLHAALVQRCGAEVAAATPVSATP